MAFCRGGKIGHIPIDQMDFVLYMLYIAIVHHAFSPHDAIDFISFFQEQLRQKQEPSWPVIPVISACFIRFLLSLAPAGGEDAPWVLSETLFALPALLRSSKIAPIV